MDQIDAERGPGQPAGPPAQAAGPNAHLQKKSKPSHRHQHRARRPAGQEIFRQHAILQGQERAADKGEGSAASERQKIPPPGDTAILPQIPPQHSVSDGGIGGGKQVPPGDGADQGEGPDILEDREQDAGDEPDQQGVLHFPPGGGAEKSPDDGQADIDQQHDVEKIEKEIEYRKLVVRKDAIEAVKEARAQGDLSENFEYYAAKKEKNQNESRIRYLERMLKTAVVISEESKEDEVGLNNTVTLYMEDDDEEETYRLVTSIRGNSLSGLISTESPIGKAILGHKVGDRVEIKVSDDFSYYVVIRKIDKTESEADDKIRSF